MYLAALLLFNFWCVTHFIILNFTQQLRDNLVTCNL